MVSRSTSAVLKPGSSWKRWVFSHPTPAWTFSCTTPSLSNAGMTTYIHTQVRKLILFLKVIFFLTIYVCVSAELIFCWISSLFWLTTIVLELRRPQECTAGGKERVSGLGCLRLASTGGGRADRWFSILLLSLSAADNLISLSFLFLVGSCFFPEFWVLAFHWAVVKGDCLHRRQRSKKSVRMEQWPGEQVSLLPKLLTLELLVACI